MSNKIIQNWIHINRCDELFKEDANVDTALMKYLAHWSKIAYTCNRPPGAAGAMLRTKDVCVFGAVEPPYNSPSCKEIGCEMENGHCVRAVHAERDAICTAAKFGVPTEGSRLYSVLKPCYECSKEIIAAGIAEIYYAASAYDEMRTRDILDRANIVVVKMNIDIGYGK